MICLRHARWASYIRNWITGDLTLKQAALKLDFVSEAESIELWTQDKWSHPAWPLSLDDEQENAPRFVARIAGMEGHKGKCCHRRFKGGHYEFPYPKFGRVGRRRPYIPHDSSAPWHIRRTLFLQKAILIGAPVRFSRLVQCSGRSTSLVPCQTRTFHERFSKGLAMS